jgi:hypothetical protein
MHALFAPVGNFDVEHCVFSFPTAQMKKAARLSTAAR